MDLHRRAACLGRNSCGQELYHVRNKRASAVSTSGFVSAADLTSSNRDVRFGSKADMAIMRRDVRFYPDETATHGVFLYKQLLDCEARWQSLSAAGLKDERRAQWSARKSLEDDLHAAGFDTESYRLGSRIGIAIARRREERDARRRDPWGTYTNAAPTGRLRRLPAPPMSEEQKRERQLAALAQEQERRQKAIAALAPHQIAALRAVVTSNGLDEFDAFTFDVLGRMGLLMRPKGTKTKTAWQLTDEGVGPAWPKKKGTGTMAGPPNRTSLW